MLISVDPNRDTPARLRQWLAAYDDDFVGLTGSLAQVEDAMGSCC